MSEGVRIGGTLEVRATTWNEMVAAYAGLIPPYPSASLIAPIRVPSPPRLQSDDLRENAWTLRLAYVAMLSGRANIPIRGEKLTSREWFESVRQYSSAINAVPLILEEGISPYSWCSFCYDILLPQRASSSIPSFSNVYSVKHFHRRLAFFYDVQFKYGGGHTRVSETHRVLVLRWSEMQRELLRLQPTTRDGVHRIVRMHFALGEFDRLVSRAVYEAQTEQTRINTAIKHGKFAW